MKTIRDLVISIKEPKNINTGWLKPTDDANYTLNFFNRGKWTGISISSICKEVTYSQLKDLRDNAKLIPGCYYRITDYQCTTTQANTKSAGHQFDIIVRADSENKLNEEAYAIHHKDDEYFANSNLSAWKLWYCIDNDTTRFAWADATNGTGVIYRMIDEWNNDVPYDFKNIIYKVTPSFLYEQWNEYYQFSRDVSIDISINGIQYYGYVTDYNPDGWKENKCWIKEKSLSINSQLYERDGSEISFGGSIEKINLDNYETYTFGKENDFSITGDCHNNIILPYFVLNKQFLNKITFVKSCYLNTFGNNCYLNTFNNTCYGNTFGNYCSYNTFSIGCCYNTIGNNCLLNTFGNNCRLNIFSNYCSSNIFGNGCNSNTFGNNCQNNTFGDTCSINTFRNSCKNIKFTSTNFTKIYNFYQHNHFEEGCEYIIFTGSETASNNNQVQNYNFAKGLKGTYNAYLTIDGIRNRSFETKVAKTSNGELKMYCEADLVQ